MRDAPAEVIALLNSGQPFVYADIFTINLKSGTTLRYTNAQSSVRVTPPGEGSPVTFTSSGVLIDGLRFKSSVGLEVDEQECKISADPSVLIDGQPFMPALRLGYFDGGFIKRDRVYAYSWETDWLGAVTLFTGYVSSISPGGGTHAMMKVKSATVVLDQDMPRNVFQTGCKNSLFDGGCTLSKAAFAVTDVAGASSTNDTINWASATAGVYDLGTVTMETGPNVGQSRSVKLSNGTQLILTFPFEYPVETGDQFKAYPGCDLSRSTCETKFSNLDNFRGFPYVPPAESAY